MSTVPESVAIIMDGNGRWAQQRHRPRFMGHIKGAQVAKKVITECAKMRLKSLTLYAFSTENWMRPSHEVQFLMRLLHRHIQRERKSLVQQNIVFKYIGEPWRLPQDVQRELEKTAHATRGNTGMVLTFALSYGGQQEIVAATKKIAEKVAQGEIASDEIDADLMSQMMQTYPTADPDLIIRTSGEQRLSNFLLWQSAYSELYFTHKHWPEFDRSELLNAFESFSHRQRRYGLVDIGPKFESSL